MYSSACLPARPGMVERHLLAIRVSSHWAGLVRSIDRSCCLARTAQFEYCLTHLSSDIAEASNKCLALRVTAPPSLWTELFRSICLPPKQNLEQNVETLNAARRSTLHSANFYNCLKAAYNTTGFDSFRLFIYFFALQSGGDDKDSGLLSP